jgi:iron complex transport system permease protein
MLKGGPPSLAGAAALFAVLAALLFASITLSVSLGAVKLEAGWILGIVVNRLSGGEEILPRLWPEAAERIVLQLRLPRALAASLAGAALSLSGVLTQALTRNALADPFLLGVSSGASTGAAAVLLLGGNTALGVFSLQAGAFAGALLASALVFVLSGAGGGRTNTTRLVLTGMAASAVFGALTNLLIFITPDVHKINAALFWMTGSFAGVDWQDIPPMLASFTAVFAAAFLLRKTLDALLMGGERALTLGVDVKNVKRGLIVLSSLLTAATVSITGLIGFAGLVVPHAARLVFGAVHRRLIPAAAIAGALFLSIADVLARVLARPEEMPVGIITALAGAPVFLFLLGRQGYKFGG